MAKSATSTAVIEKSEAEKNETVVTEVTEIKRPMFPLETRIVNGQEFKFLNIDKPEKWDSNEAFASKYKLPIPNSNKVIAFPIRGLSYSEWEAIEVKYPIPTYNEEDAPIRPGVPNVQYRENYEKQKNLVETKRKILVLEASTGKEIPGETIEQKIEWLEKLGAGESEALFDRILSHYSNSNSGLLIDNYNSAFKIGANGVEVIEFNDFDDWMTLSDTGHIFRMQRPFEDYICEIKLKKLSESKKKEINDNCKDPQPPSKPGKNPVSGQIDPSYVKYNYDDPMYRQAAKANTRKKIVMQLESVLPFEIPGTSNDEKFKWIGKRLIGDVIKLRDFVEDEIMNYRSRFNFFTEA